MSADGSPAPPRLTASAARSRVGLALGPALALLLIVLPPPEGLDPAAWRTAAVGVLMATWWITEAIPIPATALVPLALFPLLGAAPLHDAAAPYANPVIFLFLGGFLLAQALQRWNLHRRMALRILRTLGSRPASLVAGFMAATAFLSMWVSNTATAVMMLPIGVSVIQLTRSGSDDDSTPFATALMLGIAYAASIGGIGTLVGTPPNALLAGFVSESYGIQIGFAQWLVVGLPMVAVMLPLAWLVLVRWVFPVHGVTLSGGRELLDTEARSLGPLRRGEALTAVVFTLTALAWILRPQLQRIVPGLSDPGIAILAGVVLFVVPADFRRGVFLLDWRSAAKLPWDVLVLFGGGLSLADAINRTGLAAWMGEALSGLGTLPVLALVTVVVLLMIFLTELTSNTASTATFLPILASLALGIGENPLLLAVPAVIAASCAFMMPVATPPNAIVFASGYVGIPRMARAGVVLNLLFTVLIPLLAWFLVAWTFGVQPGVLPDWVHVPSPGGS